jgi:hypothetical protein
MKIWITKDKNGVPCIHFTEPFEMSSGVWLSDSWSSLNINKADLPDIAKLPNGGMASGKLSLSEWNYILKV